MSKYNSKHTASSEIIVMGARMPYRITISFKGIERSEGWWAPGIYWRHTNGLFIAGAFDRSSAAATAGGNCAASIVSERRCVIISCTVGCIGNRRLSNNHRNGQPPPSFAQAYQNIVNRRKKSSRFTAWGICRENHVECGVVVESRGGRGGNNDESCW